MSIPLKSRNHFNFFAPNKCRFLFKPIIFVYSCKQSESVHNISKMAAYCNLNNNEISKELLVNKFNMIKDNQCRLTPNDQKIPLPNEPQRSPGFVQKQPTEVFCKKRFSKKFANFTGKHLCWSLFLIKFHVFRPTTLLKRDSNTGVFL